MLESQTLPEKDLDLEDTKKSLHLNLDNNISALPAIS